MSNTAQQSLKAHPYSRLWNVAVCVLNGRGLVKKLLIIKSDSPALFRNRALKWVKNPIGVKVITVSDIVCGQA